MNLQALKILYNSLHHLQVGVLNDRIKPIEFFLSSKVIEAAIYGVKNAPREADLLTLKERSRLVEVRSIQSQGGNPYTLLANKGQLGGSITADLRPQVAERSEARTSQLEDKWSEKFEAIPLAELDISFPDFKEHVPLKLYCSFCDIEVEESRATLGTGKPRKIVKHEIILVGRKRQIKETITHVTDKLTACPGCSLNIKPIMRTIKDESGKVIGEEIVSQGTKFPLGD